MSPAQMREGLKKNYGPAFRAKVDKKSDRQVTAVYLKLSTVKGFKK